MPGAGGEWPVGLRGSVLRSQGTLGPAGLSRWRATGIRVSTFLCSLRPDPLPLGDWEPVPGGRIPGDRFGACPYTGLVKGGADVQFF